MTTSSSRSSTSTKPTSPAAAIANAIATSTVITVQGSEILGFRRKSMKESPPPPLVSPPVEEEDEDDDEVPVVDLLVGNTHIIKVSGPVTNLDETVKSAEQLSEVLQQPDESQQQPPVPSGSPAKVIQTTV
jgi:hypothetical protein